MNSDTNRQLTLNNNEIVETDAIHEFNKKMFERFKNIHLEPKPTHELDKKEQALEILKCKYNILYYLQYYCKCPLSGGGYTDIVLNDKLCTVALLYQASVKTTFGTSRQSSKTTSIIACSSWYVNFWKNVKMLFYNMKAKDNKKNLVEVKKMLAFLPKWMRTYDPKVHPNNVESFKNGLESELALMTVDKIDPTASGRGNTAAIYFDEFAFIHNIHLAYSPIMFAYANYSRISRKNYVPAPMVITSTPADPITAEGELFQTIWNEAYEVSYDDIKDMLPHEIYDFIISKNEKGIAKVFQFWYEYPGRCDKKLYDESNENNILHILNDPFVDINELEKYSEQAAIYLKEVRSLVTSKTMLRQEVYCEFISSTNQSIFEDDFIESIPKKEPLNKIKMPYTIYGDLDIYIEYNEIKVKDTNYVISVDPAYRVKGDFAGIVIYNLETDTVEATAKLKLGKLNNLVEVVKFIHSFYPKSVILIERNNFGIAILEKLLEEPRLNKQIFYSYGNKDPRRMSSEQKINNKIYGIQTDSNSRPKMIQMLIKYVLANPDKLNSKELIKELLYLQEKKNGRVEAFAGQHDDLVMALSFILYLKEYKEKELNMFKTLSASGISQLYNITNLNKKEYTKEDKLLKQYYNSVNEQNYTNGSYDLSAFKDDNNCFNMLQFITRLNK